MSCNYCRLPERKEPPFFDILREMIEMQKAGINTDIETVAIDETPAFKIRLYSKDVEIVRYIPQYHAPFIESVIDAMLTLFEKGGQK